MVQVSPTVVVGVVISQKPGVVRAAIQAAQALGATVVCAHVDSGRYVVEEHADGTVSSLPNDADAYDSASPHFPRHLRESLAEQFAGTGVEWEARELAGNPATALSHLAQRLDAAVIVVGTRRSGLRGKLGEFMSGSVAARLSHCQHRPVLVIPQDPTLDGTVPRESAE